MPRLLRNVLAIVTGIPIGGFVKIETCCEHERSRLSMPRQSRATEVGGSTMIAFHFKLIPE